MLPDDPTIDQIRKAFGRPLPGPVAHLRMVPEHRVESLKVPPPPDARPAGVLILLYPFEGELRLPLIRRTIHHADVIHSGQVSLPGGCQKRDESLRETALREACEEIGAPCGKAEMLGDLSPLYIPRSHYLVTPTVSYITHRPDFRCDAHEVADLIEVPLRILLDPGCIRCEQWELLGSVVEVPFYQVGPHPVWGATAMILSEFLLLLEGHQDPIES